VRLTNVEYCWDDLMLKALMVDLENRVIKTVYWAGGLLTDEFDVLLSCEHHETVTELKKINGIPINLYYGLGKNPALENFGWRLRGDHNLNINFFSSIILPVEDNSYPYNGFYINDCPISYETAVSNIEWVSFDETFSKIIILKT
jgi:hypothetical protein